MTAMHRTLLLASLAALAGCAANSAQEEQYRKQGEQLSQQHDARRSVDQQELDKVCSAAPIRSLEALLAPQVPSSPDAATAAQLSDTSRATTQQRAALVQAEKAYGLCATKTQAFHENYAARDVMWALRSFQASRKNYRQRLASGDISFGQYNSGLQAADADFRQAVTRSMAAEGKGPGVQNVQLPLVQQGMASRAGPGDCAHYFSDAAWVNCSKR